MPDLPQKRFSKDSVEKWKGAFLFAGPIGSKTETAADQVAKNLLGRIENHPDLIRIAPDKKNPKSEKVSIRIETIRDLIHRLALKPFEGSRRVVILEEAEMMTEEAANSLLKTLEEPPEDLLFILISAAPERLPGTIRSRCKKILFPIEKSVVQERLRTTFADWRDSFAPLLQNPPSFSAASKAAESAARKAGGLPPLFELLRSLWHDMALFRETGESESLLLPDASDLVAREAAKRPSDRIFREIDLIGETERAVEGNVNRTLALERLFVKLTEGGHTGPPLQK